MSFPQSQALKTSPFIFTLTIEKIKGNLLQHWMLISALLLILFGGTFEKFLFLLLQIKSNILKSFSQSLCPLCKCWKGWILPSSWQKPFPWLLSRVTHGSERSGPKGPTSAGWKQLPQFRCLKLAYTQALSLPFILASSLKPWYNCIRFEQRFSQWVFLMLSMLLICFKQGHTGVVYAQHLKAAFWRSCGLSSVR